MSKIIQDTGSERMTRKLPDFKPGDTVVVQIKVVEGDRERVQAYEGVVIASSNRGLTPRSPCARCRTARAWSALSRHTARHQRGLGQASRQRAARQAVLPARAHRQGRAHRREGLARGGAMAALRRSIVHGLWRGLDVLRRFLHLLCCWCCSAVVLGALRGRCRACRKGGAGGAPRGRPRRAARPASHSSALSTKRRAPVHAETLLWDLTDSDPRRRQRHAHPVLVLDLETFDGGGQPSSRSWRARSASSAPAARKSLPTAPILPQEPYYLAAQADEIYLDPFGFVLLDGYGRYRMFFKDALDKLSVDINVFRVGKFKSAVRPTRATTCRPRIARRAAPI